MKNKLLFFLAICFIMPCAFLLTACGPESQPPHTHNWQTQWSSNYHNHWLACDGCDEIKDKDSHDLDGYYCTVCEYNTLHDHQYNSTYYKDPDGHWQYCVVCDEALKTSHTGSICTTCGYDESHSCSYVYNEYKVDENYHWQECTGCDGTTTKTAHGLDSRFCSACGYKADADIVKFRAGTLEILTLQTDDGGVAIAVKLPDGKNMLIDTAYNLHEFHGEVKSCFYDYYETHLDIDYLVITNTYGFRTGNFKRTLQELDVKKVFIPDTTNVAYESQIPQTYKDGVNYANSLSTCEVVTVKKDKSIKITNAFTYNEQEYSYTIDLIAPVAASDCAIDADASIFVAIEYQDKVTLLTSDATIKNIDAYALGDYDYDVDILITGYCIADDNTDAIRTSWNRGTDFLADINLTETDHAILTYYGDVSGFGIHNLVNVLIQVRKLPRVYNVGVYATLSSKIALDGTITHVIKEEK